MRIGIGFDSHPLVSGRKLVLGGVEVPFSKGLEGWSDADVLTHAVMDALLGAAAQGDIGMHFPPGDAGYKSISSLLLLAKVKGILAARGWRAGNIDVTVVAEKPRLSEHIHAMRLNLSEALGVSLDCVSVKASTSNGLGFIGREDGITAYAIAMIEKG